MHDCVGSYSPECKRGHYRVFYVKQRTPQGKKRRYTAGLVQRGAGDWRVDQVMGVCNAIGPSDVRQATEKLALEYSRVVGLNALSALTN